MTDVVTYRLHTDNNKVNIPTWLAYVVLPDSSLWGVRFEGETEEIAKANAVAVYEAEKAKHKQTASPHDDGEPKEVKLSSGPGRGQHLIGTVCMINHAQKRRMRCAAAEVNKFEAQGWVKGGPRTPFIEG